MSPRRFRTFYETIDETKYRMTCVAISLKGKLLVLIDTSRTSVNKDTNSRLRWTKYSLRSRRLEVVGEREKERARGRHAPVLFFAHYFQVPATQARQNTVIYIKLSTRASTSFCYACSLERNAGKV